MDTAVFDAALGGLLHDVGALALRAGAAPARPWDAAARTAYGQAHALLAESIAADLPAQWQGALLEAARHHHPHTRLARLVAAADALSAGEPEPPDEEAPARLLSIFSRIAIPDGAAPPAERYLPLRPLALREDTLFAGPAGPLPGAAAAYASLWAAFKASLSDLQHAYTGPGADGAAYLGNLLQLLRRFTWCVPATPDASLYDHSRTTAALAACLAERSDAELEALLAGAAASELTVALLVAGDLSGVQGFLYTVTPRGAASALRGRSLYLQLLSDAVAAFLLRHLQLPPTSLLYSSGGRFCLLVPPSAAAELPELQQHVSRVLLRHHGGDLYLGLGHQPLAASSFFGGRFAAQWDSVNAALRRSKERRFSELGAELHQLLFVPWRDEGNEERVCQVCHQEHPHCRLDGEVRKCPACRALEDDLGDPLRRARYLCLDEVQPSFDDSGPAGTPHDVLAAFGLRVRLLADLAPAAGAGIERRHLLALDDERAAALQPAPRCVVGRRFLVNVTPIGPGGAIRTNEELAAAASGIRRLGVLRMDVDNLGKVFSAGLGRLATLSRMAALSQAISQYFEGWVDVLARRHNPEGAEHRAYSIYSGGDDLFFVGSWDAMAGLAREICAGFAEYTGHHPDLHLSGGLVLVTERYPIYQAARDAGEAEEDAKAVPGKNSFCFLGQALPWPLLERAAGLADQLCALLESRKVSRSLARLLMVTQAAYDEACRRALREGGGHTVDGRPQGYYGPWIPRAEYALARQKELHRGAAAEIDGLRRLMKGDNYRSIAWIGLAARWAELKTRAKSETEKGA